MKISGRAILFVEDDKQLMRRLSDYFSVENAVVFVSSIREARKYLRFISFDALVLDIILPDGCGLDLLKSMNNLPPTIIYSCLSNEYDILNALSLGAADYIIKPCSMQLLEAKIKLRLLPSGNVTLSSNGLVLNPITRQASYYNEKLSLTSSEFNVLYFLMQNSNKFFTSDELYEKIWSAKSLNSATVRKHLSSMRKKLAVACPNTELIINDFGKGYSFIGEVTFE